MFPWKLQSWKICSPSSVTQKLSFDECAQNVLSAPEIWLAGCVSSWRHKWTHDVIIFCEVTSSCHVLWHVSLVHTARITLNCPVVGEPPTKLQLQICIEQHKAESLGQHQCQVSRMPRKTNTALCLEMRHGIALGRETQWCTNAKLVAEDVQDNWQWMGWTSLFWILQKTRMAKRKGNGEEANRATKKKNAAQNKEVDGCRWKNCNPIHFNVIIAMLRGETHWKPGQHLEWSKWFVHAFFCWAAPKSGWLAASHQFLSFWVPLEPTCNAQK